MEHIGKVTLACCAALIALSSGCQQRATRISEDDIKIANAEPLPSKTNSLIGHERLIKPTEPDHVPESIAQSLLRQLETWPENGKQLAEGLYRCSAVLASNRLGDKSACLSDFAIDPDEACLKKHHYGRKSVGQALTADRFDLNNDGINDYIISDRYYCPDLSANQSNVYFVMLSAPDGSSRLSFAGWATSDLSVIDDKRSGKKVLIEQMAKSYGKYTRIFHLVNDKYVSRACIEQDESGYRACSQ